MATTSGVAATPAPVVGPAVSIASLVLANVIALLLNPGLFHSRCVGAGPGRARPSNDGSPPTAETPDAAAATLPTPRRCRCCPAPFFASNVCARAAAKQAGAAAAGDGERPHAPLPRELWGFDVLSPRHALSSWLAPSSSGGTACVDVGGGGGDWRPALWVLLPLHALTLAYFATYVLMETLWSESRFSFMFWALALVVPAGRCAPNTFFCEKSRPTRRRKEKTTTDNNELKQTQQRNATKQKQAFPSRARPTTPTRSGFPT